ncbi:hypothetical protein EDD16DRAFT_1172176 [Pisolithus croceorrhizus]|nr:hypothetical protein EDD16DRAFT_1172176 [Pisolithus croceorrhizus]
MTHCATKFLIENLISLTLTGYGWSRQARSGDSLRESKKSYHEGGIPIGAALVYHGSPLDPSDAVVLGCSHNQRIQKSSPTLHAEIAALEDAGRLKADVYTKSTMVGR